MEKITETIINNYIECNPCFNLGQQKKKNNTVDDYVEKLPGINLVLNRMISHIFSNGLIGGNDEETDRLNYWLYSENSSNNTNITELRQAIQEAILYGSCGMYIYNGNIYIKKQGFYQKYIIKENGIENVVGYTIAENGSKLSKYQREITINTDLTKLEENIKNAGLLWLTDENFIEIRNDITKPYGESPLLKDKDRLNLMLKVYDRLNYDIEYDGPGRLILRVKNGYAEAPEGQEITTAQILDESIRAKRGRYERAINQARQIAEGIRNTSSDNVIVLSDDFSDNVEKLERVTKATEFFEWLKNDTAIISEIFAFDSVLCGVGEFSGNVAMTSVIDNAVLSTVVPLRDFYASQFSQTLSKILGISKVMFNKYELRQTVDMIDRIEKIANIIYKLEISKKQTETPNEDLTKLSDDLTAIISDYIHNAKGDIKDISDI